MQLIRTRSTQVSGGTPGAQTGTLTIMASGSASAYEKVKPALDAMGSKVYHVGTNPGQVSDKSGPKAANSPRSAADALFCHS